MSFYLRLIYDYFFQKYETPSLIKDENETEMKDIVKCSEKVKKMWEENIQELPEIIRCEDRCILELWKNEKNENLK